LAVVSKKIKNDKALKIILKFTANFSKMSNIVEVAVAAIINAQNEVLISLRPQHVHQGGLWEFPGGRLEAGETVEQALHRELKEELNISVQGAQPLITLKHNYGDISVRLHVWKVTRYSSPRYFSQGNVSLNHRSGAEGQKIKWQALSALAASQFPAANQAIITALQLPNEYLITGCFQSIADFKTRLTKAINAGIGLLQLRLKPTWVEANSVLARQAFKVALELCKKNKITLMLNIPEALRLSMLDELNNNKTGMHLDSSRLNGEDSAFRQQQSWCKYVSASCHTVADIEKAKNLGADFIVLSPVQKTSSHPEATPLGWQSFSEYVKDCDFPVYALGGVTPDDIKLAQQHGGQGIAGISYAW